MRPSVLPSPRLFSMQAFTVVIAFLALCSAYRQNISKWRIVEPRALSLSSVVNDAATTVPSCIDPSEIISRHDSTSPSGPNLKVRSQTASNGTAAAQGDNVSQGSPIIGGIVGGIIGGTLGLINLGAAFYIIRKHYRKYQARAEAYSAYKARGEDSDSRTKQHAHAYHSEYMYPSDSHAEKAEVLVIERFSRTDSEIDLNRYSRASTISHPSPAVIHSKFGSMSIEKERIEGVSETTSSTLRNPSWSRRTSLSLPQSAVATGPSQSRPTPQGPDRSFIIWD